jgi:hypothetical protein
MKNYSKEDFSYVVSSITGFTDQTSTELMMKALVGGTTAKVSNVKLGVKGTQQIQILDNSPAFQAGACGWSPSGTTTFSQISLTVCPERVNEALCPDALYSTYQSLLLQKGETEESVPFEMEIGNLYVKKIQQRIETKLWQATTSGGDCFNGFKSLLVSGATGTAVSDTPTAFSPTVAYGTAGNPITEVDKLINALDDNAQAIENLVVFMSYANYRLYVQALTKANFFQNYIGSSTVIGGEANAFAVHPNSTVKVYPTLGLNGSGRVVIGPSDYFIVGFDALSDSEKLDMWWSRDSDEIRIRGNFNYGAALVRFAGVNYFATNNIA